MSFAFIPDTASALCVSNVSNWAHFSRWAKQQVIE